MIAQLLTGYRLIQALSLDVVLGSGLLTLAIARYYAVDVPLAVVLGLMIAVWLIYSLDHLSDAKKGKAPAATYRHRFHQRHYQTIWYGVVIMTGLGLVVLSAMPLLVLAWGALCVVFILCYFLLIRLSAFWPKELLIALGYTGGVFLGPLCLTQASLSLFQYLLIPQIFLLALANLLIFSCFDWENDQQDGHYSLAIHLGGRTSRWLALSLLSAGILICLGTIFTATVGTTIGIQVLVLVMNLLLLLLLLYRENFRRHDLYRVIGDGIFFIPALILLYGR